VSGGEAGVAAETQPTVMVVDGEVLVRLAIAGYLRDCGYRVVEAAGADEARAVIEAGVAEVSIALIGLHGPGDPASGFALARWLRAERPGVEVVLAGSPARAADAAGDICAHGPLLARPYEPQVVLDRIRRLLARRSRRGPGAREGEARDDPGSDPAR
jgi:DNA-binding response OmpR family regulator